MVEEADLSLSESRVGEAGGSLSDSSYAAASLSSCSGCQTLGAKLSAKLEEPG